MQHEFEDHWFSAYLDDELSADERALVERRLADDPAARELLEDLKRVRGLVSTLPRWSGDDLQISRPEQLIRSAVGAALTQAEPTDRVAQSSSAIKAEASNLENQDAEKSEDSRFSSQVAVGAERRTQQSMRWTSIVAVAAGLATLLLGLPYLLRDYGPAIELAGGGNATKDAPQRPDATSDFAAAIRESPLALPIESVQDEPTSGPSEARRSASREEVVGSVTDSFGGLLSDRSERSDMMPMATAGLDVAAEPTQRFGSEVPGAEAPSMSGLPDAGLSPLVMGGTAGATRSATSEPLSLPSATLETARADMPQPARTALAENAPTDALDGQPKEPALFYAYSQAWTAPEVDSAIKEVWNFLEPSGSPVAVAAADELQNAAGQKNRSRYNYQDADLGDTAAPSSPAVGIASLPDNQSVTAWYEQLQPGNRLVELNRLSRTAAQNGGSARAEQPPAPMTLQPMLKSLSDLKTGETANAGRSRQTQVQTGDSLALFVTVAEARNILSTLESQRKLEADTKKKTSQGQQFYERSWADQNSQFFRQQPLPEGLQDQAGMRTLEQRQLSQNRQLHRENPANAQEQKSATELQLLLENAEKVQQAPRNQQVPQHQQSPEGPERLAERELALKQQRATGDTANEPLQQALEKDARARSDAAVSVLPPAWWARSRGLLDNGVKGVNGAATDDAKVILILNQAPAP